MNVKHKLQIVVADAVLPTPKTPSQQQLEADFLAAIGIGTSPANPPQIPASPVSASGASPESASFLLSGKSDCLPDTETSAVKQVSPGAFSQQSRLQFQQLLRRIRQHEKCVRAHVARFSLSIEEIKGNSQ
jgi:hypothetical protein